MSIYRMRTEFGHYLKPILGLIAFIFLVGAIYSFGTAPKGSNKNGPGAGDTIAKVGDSEITRGEFEDMWGKIVERAKDMRIRSPLMFTELRARTFQQLITNRLVVESAKKMGVDINDRKVDQEYDKQVAMKLRESRRGVLGKLTKAQEAIDPRDDRDYKTALERAGDSLDRQVSIAESQISKDDIKFSLAQMGLEQKFREQMKPVTDADVMASYNTYKYRQILLASGSMPKGQLKTRAEKLQQEARGGADFGTLAKKNSDDPTKQTGGEAVYTWDGRSVVPLQVRSALEKLQPGGISPIIETPYGIYLVKLEGVSPNVPAKLDAKAKAARRDEIGRDRMAEASDSFMRNAIATTKIDVTDPELDGYFLLTEAQGSANVAEAQAKVNEAIKSLQKAKDTRGGNYAMIKLAMLLFQTGKTEDAITTLYPMLEGKNSSIEGGDLRVLLGDMLLKTGKPEDKKRALDQYKIASEVAQTDLNVRQQLVSRFRQVGQPDLAAKEATTIAEYQKAMEQRSKNGAAPGGPLGMPGVPSTPGG